MPLIQVKLIEEVFTPAQKKEMIAKLTDGEGNFVWRPTERIGEPDMLLGHPVRPSEFAPSTFTASQYVGIIGDFSYYWISDAVAQAGIQRLDELFRENDQVGFIARAATDGMPTFPLAFARVTLAS